MNRISNTSLVTLHYRMRQPNGATLISTFESSPATLQLGQGELLPSIESRLIGLNHGDSRSFEFAPGEAFGPHQAHLMERIKRSDLPADVELEAHTVLSFTAPDGNSFSGLILELNTDDVLIDFNHPLAGKAVIFEVEIIGVL